MKVSILAFVIMIQFTSCSSTQHMRSAEQLSEDVEGKVATIVFKSGYSCAAENIVVRDDTTKYVINDTREPKQVATAEILSIQFNSHGRGAVAGLFYGMGISVVTMAILTSIGPPSESSGEEGVKNLLVFTGGVAGSVIGVTIGAISGYDKTFLMEKDTSIVPKKENKFAH